MDSQITHRYRLCCMAILLTCGLTAQADSITIRNETHQGSFEGYSNSTFTFRKKDGEILEETRSLVRELKLDPPCKTQVTLSRSSDSEERLMKGYKAMKFVFVEGDKEKTDFANVIDEIKVQRPMASAGGKTGTSGQEVIPRINLSGVEDNPALSPQQKTAIDNYKKARAEYDAFLTESSALVAEMDAAKGARREDLLNRLRMRKNEEMPIKQALQNATNELLALFPPME